MDNNCTSSILFKEETSILGSQSNSLDALIASYLSNDSENGMNPAFTYIGGTLLCWIPIFSTIGVVLYCVLLCTKCVSLSSVCFDSLFLLTLCLVTLAIFPAFDIIICINSYICRIAYSADILLNSLDAFLHAVGPCIDTGIELRTINDIVDVFVDINVHIGYGIVSITPHISILLLLCLKRKTGTSAVFSFGVLATLLWIVAGILFAAAFVCAQLDTLFYNMVSATNTSEILTNERCNQVMDNVSIFPCLVLPECVSQLDASALPFLLGYKSLLEFLKESALLDGPIRGTTVVQYDILTSMMSDPTAVELISVLNNNAGVKFADFTTTMNTYVFPNVEVLANTGINSHHLLSWFNDTVIAMQVRRATIIDLEGLRIAFTRERPVQFENYTISTLFPFIDMSFLGEQYSAPIPTGCSISGSGRRTSETSYNNCNILVLAKAQEIFNCVDVLRLYTELKTGQLQLSLLVFSVQTFVVIVLSGALMAMKPLVPGQHKQTKSDGHI